MELFILSKLTADPVNLVKRTLVSLFVTRIVIYCWQIIGLFRAIEHNYIADKNLLKTRALQSFALLTILFTIVYSLDVIQGAVFYKRQVEINSKPDAKVTYQLSFNDNKQQLTISGGLDIGITTNVRSLTERNPQLISVILNSYGGQIYEGRGLSKLFIELQLDTYVYDECSSACATAFIGGKTRYLSTTGKLGFHQYKIDTSAHRLFVPFNNLQAEQERDLDLFKSRQITSSFLDKMFDQPANKIWFPDHKTLLNARIIHHTIP